MSGGAAAWAFEVRNLRASVGAREFRGEREFMLFRGCACTPLRVQGVDEVGR